MEQKNKSGVALAAIAGAAIVLAMAGKTSTNDAPLPVPSPAPIVPSEKMDLLFFTQSGCQPCVVLKKSMEDAGVSAYINGHFVLVTPKKGDSRWKQYNITGTPTLVAVTPSGPQQKTGAMSPDELLSWLKSVTGDDKPIVAGKPGAPVIGGRTSPDGKVTLTVDLPASQRKKNIASKGLGCCVFRSGEYAARWQQVPELYDLPEKMVKAGIEGGGYPEKVDKVFHKFGPNVQYVQDTNGDPDVLEAILKTGRMPCVTYDGHDPHYGMGQSIAHMVCLPYFDRKTGWAAVSDNNFTGENDFVWMSTSEFMKRWKGGGGSGWVYALLSPPPPPIPHN